MSSNQQQEGAQQGSTNSLSNAVISSSSSNIVVINQENNENEVNSSIGSNRSLNGSRIFPFRIINRDIILNNVSSMSFKWSH